MNILLEKVKVFVNTEIIPYESAWLNGDLKEAFKALENVRKKAKSAGLWLPQMPKHCGGLGLTLHEFGQWSAISGQSIFGHYAFNCQAPDAGNMELLELQGSEKQKERWLKPLCDGKMRSCFGMTEPMHAGSNPTVLSTNATKEGDFYRLNGRKWFTTAAEDADFCIVMAVTNPEAALHQRASMFIVPTETVGFKLERNLSIMGDEGFGWLSHGEVSLTNVIIPAENRIGEEGKGFAYAQLRLAPGRIHHCMRWMGICNRAFAMMCERARTRDLGNGKTLGDQQTIQNWIAESYAEIQAATQLILKTAQTIDNQGEAAARNDIHAIKFYAAGVLERVLDRGIQVHGGFGLMDECILSWFYRHERAARIYDGPDEVHKAALAKKILKGKLTL
jgi:acyl-CoA dehydrogenase